MDPAAAIQQGKAASARLCHCHAETTLRRKQDTTTKRKPYVRGMQPNWWTKLGFIVYITREGTCLPQLLVQSGCTVRCICTEKMDQKVMGFSWIPGNPIVMLINRPLSQTVFHTATWFKLCTESR